MKIRLILPTSVATIALFGPAASAATNITPTEEDYYPLLTVETPEHVELEVGGLSYTEDDKLAVSTRKGEVWVIDNPHEQNGQAAHFTRFASGLHEPLGLAYKEGSYYLAQRGELTRLQDSSGNGVADLYQTVYAWPLSAHYHEYSYGPKIAADGSMFVTTNVAFGAKEWWRGESRVPWRGWTLKISPTGDMEPWAVGMRSPAGIGMLDDEFFYTDNQGDWMPSGGVWHLTRGAFSGHPAGLRWTGEPGSPVSLSAGTFFSTLDEKRIRKSDGARIDPLEFVTEDAMVKPDNVAEEQNPATHHAMLDVFPELKLPAVWLPHGILGVSNSEIVVDNSGGDFGPFSGQLFVGDQGQSKIMRVSLEKVNGEYQGAAFNFRSGFQSGILRLAWGKPGSLFAGQTDRGWGSSGTRHEGLQRISWSGETPMEIETVRAMPDGFELTFTRPVDRDSALDLNSYSGRSYTYKYFSVYGSPPIYIEDLDIRGVSVSEDGLRARLLVDKLRQFYIHEIHVPGIRSQEQQLPVLHPAAYYTLNNIPIGDVLNPDEVSTARSEGGGESAQDAQSLLTRHGCLGCHHKTRRQVGPSFREIAERGYSEDRIIELIYQPEPKNWPDYATPMAPMPHVPEREARVMAQWIVQQ
jgi:cytochrome c551/c552